MVINRRGFLKRAVSTPLTKLALGSEEETREEEERYTPFCYRLAHNNLDFAVNYLKGVMKKEYTGPHRTYASNVDSGVRFISIGVWAQRCSCKDVKTSYIPLLEKARDSIDLNDPAEIKKHDPAWIKNNADYPTSAMHVKACIQGRIYNLENYCSGKRSDSEDGFARVRKEGKYHFIED